MQNCIIGGFVRYNLIKLFIKLRHKLTFESIESAKDALKIQLPTKNYNVNEKTIFVI